MDDRAVGECSGCRHARVQRSAKGSDFWRCLRADEDGRFPRYPPLPVRGCPGFARATRAEPEEGGSAEEGGEPFPS